MELIEGETLKDRIKSGPIPVEEALKLALQMAEALEAAHEKGVIHRDLKPANIKVTPDGKVKILDFGLAKAYVGDQENLSPMDSPTISAAATQQGVILGTAAYMSPEQARGKPVDKRADIWAFGVVLYEVLTGKQVFSGDTVSDTLASVLAREPEWQNLPPNLHSRIRFLLERCFEKEAKDRYSGINDARVEIQKVLSDPSGIFAQPLTTAEPQTRSRSIIPWIVSILGILIVGAAVWYLKPAPPPELKRVMRFEYELPGSQQFTSNIQLAVSPDGSQFVYLTTDGLYLRSVDALDARPVAGTDLTSRQPAFSPDGRWIAYWSLNDQKLKKIAISGGVPVVLCDTSQVVSGLSWNSDNTILYGDVYGGGVKRVSADGGTPESLIEAEIANVVTDGMPVFPRMLPDGKTLLFTKSYSATNLADRQITVQSLESGERKVLVGGLDAMYLSSGHLVYIQVNDNITSLVAVPFDLDTLEVKGGPVPLLESISAGALSEAGTLVYVPGTIESASLRTLVWVDREGNEEPLGAPPNLYFFPNISPDGTRVALTVGNYPERDIWIWDVIRKNLVKLTFHDSQVQIPIWTPDGKRIVYYSEHESPNMGDVYWKAADGTGETEKLASDLDRSSHPHSFSSDGKYLVMQEIVTQTNVDVSMLSIDSDRKRIPLLQTEYVEGQPKISPDGQLMAYASNESGRNEVCVRRFPDVNKGKWQISTNGGSSPIWSPDGQELFYLSEDNSVMAVAVQTSPMVTFDTPKILFQSTNVGFTIGEGTPWDIHPDGKRFLMIKQRADYTSTEEASQPRINVVLNWFEELKQRVPVD
jgi:Tol biopolymer transport system component